MARDSAARHERRAFSLIARRGTKIPTGVPEGLSGGFAEDFIKQTQWTSSLRKNRLSAGSRTLADVVRELRDFFFVLNNLSR